MKYSFLIALFIGNSQEVTLHRFEQLQHQANLAQKKGKRISLESQETITDAVNDVLKVTQEREPEEGPKVAVHEATSQSADAPPPQTLATGGEAGYPYPAPGYGGGPVGVVSQPYPVPGPPVGYPVPSEAIVVQGPSPPPVHVQVPVPVPQPYPVPTPVEVPTPYPVEVPIHHHHVHETVREVPVLVEKEVPTVVVKEQPAVVIEKEVPKVIVRDPTPEIESESPNSSVMRAIASANEQSSADKVHEEREVADKLERLEHQSAINDAINKSVKEEEQKVIEEANRRMADVHARKAQEANKAAHDIEKAQDISKKFIDQAKMEESRAINKVIADHASATIA